MLGPIVRWKIGSAEKHLGVPLEYLRHMYADTPDAFHKFVKFQPLSDYRKHLPAAPYHVARIVATKHEDCGTCVQIAVNLAKKDGIDTAVVRAAVDGKTGSLPESLADVYRFAAAVSAGNDDPDLRERVRKVFGEEALAELAMAIAFARVYPTVKRALGFATTCAKVTVEV